MKKSLMCMMVMLLVIMLCSCKVNKKETIIAGNCVIDSGLNTTGNIKIYGKINGSIKVDGDVLIGETSSFIVSLIVSLDCG